MPESGSDKDPEAPAGRIEGDPSSGQVHISDDVVGVIAGIAAGEVEGIAGMTGGFVGGISEMMTGKKNLAKGVKVEVSDTETTIDLFVVVDYGIRIPAVAQLVQENVKKAVESMTGLRAVGVNIHIQGVSFPGDEHAARRERVK